MNTTHTNAPTEPNAKSMEGRLLETISLRDYFAAKAMQGFAACPDVSWPHTAEMAVIAYKWADAMLKAREA